MILITMVELIHNDAGFADANNNGMDDASECNTPTDTRFRFYF